MRGIRKVAVLGAGTMGSQIAAHLANAGIPCVLLDRATESPGPHASTSALTPERAAIRSRLAQAGLDAALKARPPAFFLPELAGLISIGNFEDHLTQLKNCDWIIEAVAEDIQVKRALLEKVQPFLGPEAIASSNTSGISLTALADGLGAPLRRRWLGAHFFNPPRYLKLLEIIPTANTEPEVVNRISMFAEEFLGKGVVTAKDRPGFIANRIGTFFTLTVLQLMQDLGLSVEEIDTLTGPVMGLPKSATFRTLDLVGLDVFAHVVKNLQASLPDDECHGLFCVPEFMRRMVDANLLGEKTKQGFYKRAMTASGAGAENEILVVDLSTLQYRPRQKATFPAVELAMGIEDSRERVRSLLTLTDQAGRFYRALFGRLAHYAASRIPEISGDLVSVDRAMRWGFSWEHGIFDLWDAIGNSAVMDLWREEHKAPPPLVKKLMASGNTSFYSGSGGQSAVFDFYSGGFIALPERPGVLSLVRVKASHGELKKNAGASLLDLGDGVLCLEFHSKMNTIGPDTVEMIHAGVNLLAGQFDAMVVGNQAANFSAGANLMLLLLAIQEGEWDEVGDAIRAFQNANMALKYAPRPVVAAPFGLTLGGGAEISLHCARSAAAAETYMGLVETGVGLIPAGGGTKEMLVRATDASCGVADADPWVSLKEIFTNLGMAKVSSSAAEARKLGYLNPQDVICMNRDRQIETAKQLALNLVRLNYHPATPREDILVLGQGAFSKMKLGLHLMRRAEYISDHDVVVGTKLAQVLSGGGEFTSPQKVSEQYLLDLEREAFLSLCGEKKTVERIQHMLRKGKPLRN